MLSTQSLSIWKKKLITQIYALSFEIPIFLGESSKTIMQPLNDAGSKTS